MNNGKGGSEKTIWEGMIRQNMVPLKRDDSHCTYELDLQKNSGVEIHFGTTGLAPTQGSKLEAVVGRRSDTVDISNGDFLILRTNPALNAHRRHIPWKDIFEIVFLDT